MEKKKRKKKQMIWRNREENGRKEGKERARKVKT